MKAILFFTLLLNALFSQNLAEITSIRANFTQKIRGDSAEAQYSGTIIATADSKAHWRYKSPMKKEIFVDKKRVMIYEPEFEQVIISDKVDLDFVSVLNSVQKKGDFWQSVVNNQTFHIALKDGKPHKIFYKDELDNEVEITLENVVLNKRVDAKIFEFKVPDSAEIIYQ
ncbi:LolA-like outer membrane lipoprotein chaperone [Helicobacter sp. 23-1045]